MARNEKPYVLSFFPHGEGELPPQALILTDDAVQLIAFKLSEDGQAYIIRLFEPTGLSRKTSLNLPALGMEKKVELQGFEIKTFRLDVQSRQLQESPLME